MTIERSKEGSAAPVILINRAPVLTLWATIVAEAMGHDRAEALSLGKAVAGLNAQSKGRSLGIYKPREAEGSAPAPKAGLGEDSWVELLGRPVPALHTADGLRAVVKDKPIAPQQVQEYLERAFGHELDRVSEAMRALAAAFAPDDLADRAYELYERFRPEIPSGRKGWGAKGVLSLDRMRELARSARS
jgi:hypothetical protein